MCVCSLSHLACKAHAPFFRLWRVWHISPHYFINDKPFEKKLLNIKCVLWLFLYDSESCLILRRIEPDIIINVRWSSCQAPVILVKFSRKLNLPTGFQKFFEYEIWWTFVEWESSCFIRTRGQSDVRKLIVVCRNFAKERRNSFILLHIYTLQSFWWTTQHN